MNYHRESTTREDAVAAIGQGDKGSQLKQILSKSVSIVRGPSIRKLSEDRVDGPDIVEELMMGGSGKGRVARGQGQSLQGCSRVYVLGERPEKNKSVPRGRNTGCLKQLRKRKISLVMMEKNRKRQASVPYDHYRETFWAHQDGHDGDAAAGGGGGDEEGLEEYVSSRAGVWEGIGTTRCL